MDKSCSIVQDLLPLYAEDMVREETKEFVAGHLSQCETCRAELSALKADVTPAPVSAQPLRDLKKQLQRKRLTAAVRWGGLERDPTFGGRRARYYLLFR